MVLARLVLAVLVLQIVIHRTLHLAVLTEGTRTQGAPSLQQVEALVPALVQALILARDLQEKLLITGGQIHQTHGQVLQAAQNHNADKSMVTVHQQRRKVVVHQTALGHSAVKWHPKIILTLQTRAHLPLKEYVIVWYS